MKRLLTLCVVTAVLATAVPAFAQTGSPQPVGPTNPFATNGPFAPASALFWFSVRDYGAVCGDIGDQSTAINAAINAAHNVKGASVVFPTTAGGCIYRITQPINLNSKVGVHLIGQTSNNGGSGSGAAIHYDNGNTDARAIDARDSAGAEIAYLTIYSNTSFAGTLIDGHGVVAGPYQLHVHHCIIGSLLDRNDSALLYLEGESHRVDDNQFTGGNYCIRGPDTPINSDMVVIDHNQFVYYNLAAINNPGGQKWVVAHNKVEAKYPTGATAGQGFINTTHDVGDLTVEDNWIGDAGTDDAITMWLRGTNISILRNFVGAPFAPAGGKVHKFITLNSTVLAFVVRDNYISGNYPTFIDFNSQIVTGSNIENNILGTDVTTVYGNAGGRARPYRWLGNFYANGARVAGDTQSTVFVRASSNAAQTLTNGVETPLTFNLEQWDDDAMHSTVSATDTFTVPVGGAGEYDLHCSAWFAAVNATGNRTLAIYKSNAPATRYSVIWDKSPSATVQSAVETHAQIRFVEGDLFQCRATQSSGGNLDTNVTDGRAMVWISATRVGY